MTFKRTKIVATIGPSSADPKTLAKLARAGMNVARLNFSHGTHADHMSYIQAIRSVAKKLNKPIGILQDLSGPKVRIGDFKDVNITLVPGKRFTLSTLPCPGTVERVFIGYPHLHEEVAPGDVILLDDGRRKLEVVKVVGRDVVTTIITGGTIKGRRGVNIPGAFTRVSPITAKDRADLAFGLAHGVDFVALSFVRSARDIKKLRTLIEKQTPKHAPAIIAKVETIEAINDIDAIIAEADGVMVARGDLAVEVSPENVPCLQKQIIRKCVAAGKPVITATQMLETMIDNPVPTRAEVGDVANAILDGTDAVMLSQETAMGEHPVEAVEMMASVARQTENHVSYPELLRATHNDTNGEVTDAVGHAVANAAKDVDARAIVVPSESGSTARLIACRRPTRLLLVFTPNESVARTLSLSYACHSFICSPFHDIDTVITESKHAILRNKLAQKGDRIVIAAGIPFGKTGGTNTLRIQTI